MFILNLNIYHIKYLESSNIHFEMKLFILHSLTINIIMIVKSENIQR
jgi:hypothetical protein